LSLWDWLLAHLFNADAPASSVLPAACGPSAGATDPHPDRIATAVETADPASPVPDVPWWRPAGASLLDPTPMPRPELTTEARAFENLLLLHFDGHNLSLPSLPHTPEKILRMLGDPCHELADIAAEIATDQVSAAAILRTANSPLYGGIRKITTIEPAVVRLGNRAIRLVMMNLSMRSLITAGNGEDARLADTFWRRALASGTIMRSLAGYTGIDADEAFLTGLLHDVGNLIVLRIRNAQPAFTRLPLEVDTFEYLCHESHQEFGELLATSWGLPDRLKSLIADHHTTVEPNEPSRLERLQLQFSDMACSLLGYAPFAPYDLLASRPARELNLAGHPGFTAFLAGLPALVKTAVAGE
jgi:HD-like signal output (HDOD) protein